MDYPNEYIDFLVHFHSDRDYFECHEIMEEYWKNVDKNNKESIWVGLIQLAVANYHHRRSNFSGAYKTLTKSLQLLTLHKNDLTNLGIDSKSLLFLINDQLLQIIQKQSYKNWNLPITSNLLLEACIKRCKQLQLDWNSSNEVENEDIIHRHFRRDRSEVINNRIKAKQQKNRQ